MLACGHLKFRPGAIEIPRPALLLLMAAVCALLPPALRGQESVLRPIPPDASIKLSASYFHTWVEDGQRVFTATGNCEIRQGSTSLAADAMVIWFNQQQAKETAAVHLRVYAERNVTLIQDEQVRKCEQFLATLETTGGLSFQGNILTHTHPQVTPFLSRAREILKKGEPEYLSRRPLPPEAPVEPLRPSGTVEIRARNFETWVDGDMRVVLLTGNVHVRKGEYELSADRAIVWFSEAETKEGKTESGLREVYAEGDVTLFRQEDVLRAKRLFQNTVENKGVMVDGQIRTWIPEHNVPLVFGGKEIRQIDVNRYQADRGYVTTDDFGKPHFRFQGDKVRLVQTKESRVVSATHNKLFVGDLPVFYWPFLSKDVKDDSYFIRDFKYGNSSKFGNFVLTAWDLYDFGFYQNDWSDATLNLDYYSRRGPAGGLDIDYRRNSFFGFIDTYYVNDQADYDRNNQLVPSTNRGRILWRNRQFLPRGYRLDSEFSYLSDRNFLREYFEEEFEEGKEQETILYLRKLYENKGLTLTGKARINYFQTTVEELPVGRSDVIGEPLFGGLVEYTSDTTLGQYKKLFDNWLHERDPPTTIRFDTSHEFSTPFKLSIVKFKPFVRGRMTAFDHRRDYLGSDWRTAAAAGIDAATNISRIYGFTNKLLDVNRVRHIITPEIKYHNIYHVSTDPDTLIQFDEVDELDDLQTLVVGFRNRFQTKRGAFDTRKIVDWINLDVEYHTFLGNAGLNQKFDDFVELDFLWRVSDRITLDSKGNEIDLGTGELDTFNFGLAFSYSPKWRFYIGHRYADSDPRRGFRGASVALFDLDYVFNEKWSASFLQHYDFRKDDNLVTKVVVTRQLPAWVFEVSFELDPGEDDTIAMFSLSPAGLSEAALQF